MILKDNIKELVNRIGKDNVDELKPLLKKRINYHFMGFDETDYEFSEEELERIYNQSNLKRDFEFCKKGLLIDNFKLVFDQFIENISSAGYVEDAIALIVLAIRSISGFSRVLALLRRNGKNINYINSSQYLEDLREELYELMYLFVERGVMNEFFLVIGLVNIVKFDLEDHLLSHGRIVETSKQHKRELNDDVALGFGEYEVINYTVNPDYIVELQQRLYTWKKVIVNLENQYFMLKSFCW